MPKGSILMIGNYLSTPRHNRNVWHSLSGRLADVGWDVLTSSSKEPKFFRLLDMLSTIVRYHKRYQVAQIDVFSGPAFIFAELSVWLLKLLRKPVILTLHGGRLPEFAEQNQRRARRLLINASIVVTPSPFLKMQMNQYRPDIRVLPNPVNLSAAIYRRRTNPVPHLVWVRAFHETYNPSLAIKVLVELVHDFSDIHLTMIGPDKGDGSLQRMLGLVDTHHLEHQVDVVPAIPHDKIPEHLDQHDIFINTTRYDTAPRSLIEAMANGLCIVSTNVGGVPWMVIDQIEALLVPSDNPQKMAGAVKRILTEPDLAGHLSERARLEAEKYSWARIMPLWDSLLMEVISKSHE